MPVWALRQFFHFLALHGHATNITAQLPYPKIEKTVPLFLTTEEYQQLVSETRAIAADTVSNTPKVLPQERNDEDLFE